jgi:dTDP-4-dehydrorhamnose 3,5-epimerase
MKIIRTDIEEILIFEPDVFRDSRGYFFESYNKKTYQDFGIIDEFVQDNESTSKQSVIRGLHYQVGENAQGKLVRVILGRILDVAVDIRFGSPTFGQHIATELSADDFRQFWIPKGFAHGFSVLSEEAILCYKCTKPYSPSDERGIVFNDPDLGIDWKVTTPIVSEKDRSLTNFKDIEMDFIYE